MPELTPKAKYNLLKEITKQRFRDGRLTLLASKAIEFFNSNNMGHIVAPVAPGTKKVTVKWDSLDITQQNAVINFKNSDFLEKALSAYKQMNRLNKSAKNVDRMSAMVSARQRQAAAAPAVAPTHSHFDDPGDYDPSDLVGRKIRLAEDNRIYTVTGYQDRNRGKIFAGPTLHTIRSPRGSDRSVKLRRKRVNPLLKTSRVDGQAFTVKRKDGGGSGRHRTRYKKHKRHRRHKKRKTKKKK